MRHYGGLTAAPSWVRVALYAAAVVALFAPAVPARSSTGAGSLMGTAGARIDSNQRSTPLQDRSRLAIATLLATIPGDYMSFTELRKPAGLTAGDPPGLR